MVTDSSHAQRPAAFGGPQGFQCTWPQISVGEPRHLVTTVPLSVLCSPNTCKGAKYTKDDSQNITPQMTC